MEMFVCELTARYRKLRNYKKEQLSDSEKVIKLIRRILPKYEIMHFEQFGTIFLDKSLNVLGYKVFSKGGISGTAVDVRILFQHALLCNASGIIIFHNHPSGSLKASKADVEITRKISNASEVLDIKLLDSFIITEKSYQSII